MGQFSRRLHDSVSAARSALPQERSGTLTILALFQVESRDTRVDAAVGDHGIRPLYMDVQATTALVGHCMDLAAVLYSECVHFRTPGYWTPCYLTSPLSMGTLTLGHTPMAGRQRRQWRKGEK